MSAGLARSRASRTCLRPGSWHRSPPPSPPPSGPTRTESPPAASCSSHDPAAQPRWAGSLRVIIHIRADLEPGDRRGPDAGRGRLVLADRGARRPHTVTLHAQRDGDSRVRHRGIRCQRRAAVDRLPELRASWSPVARPTALHEAPPGAATARSAGGTGWASAAWCGAIARAAAGLPPLGGGDRDPAARPAARPMRGHRRPGQVPSPAAEQPSRSPAQQGAGQ